MIRNGMLYISDDPNASLADIVDAAVTKYKDKHKHEPTFCFAHPLTLGSEQYSKGDYSITLAASKVVPPNQFFLGVIPDMPSIYPLH